MLLVLGNPQLSAIMRRVCKIITVHLTSKYIKFPKTKEEMEELSSLFYVKHGFPQCIGAIDGTHVPMKQPSKNSTNYKKRKGRYSLNIQAVADHRHRFTDVLIK